MRDLSLFCASLAVFYFAMRAMPAAPVQVVLPKCTLQFADPHRQTLVAL